jgi:hypothetical protein
MNWKQFTLTTAAVIGLASPAAFAQDEAAPAPAPAAPAPAAPAPVTVPAAGPATARPLASDPSSVGRSEHRAGRRYWNHRHEDGTIHRHYYRHRRHPRFYTSFYDPFYSPFGYPYGYGYGYPYYGASASLYYNGYRPYRTRPQYRRSGGSVVADVQRELARAGYYRGAIDGVYGPGTRAAIRAFERDNGLRIDGQIDSRLLGTLGLR